MTERYGFYFEEAGLSRPQGAIASDEEHFEGSSAEQSVARELGQNSLDAADDTGAPVRMVFELREMPTASIPDIDTLRGHLDCVVEATEGQKGHERMKRAADASRNATQMVLRVGDYGTTGLLGTESIGDARSPLVALTRGAGISANDGARGGSFGIGSAVASMSADLCTVLWTSLATDKQDVVFAGYSRLATHTDSEGTRRQADGFYTSLSNTDDFEYLRNPSALGPFEQRTQPGTDVYILGYRMAADDPGLTHIWAAFVRSFFVAIHSGRLVVEGRTPKGDWILNQDTLPSAVKAMDDVLPFYRALLDPDPYTEEVPGLGELRLFVEVDDSLPRKLHTITVRGPLMRIGQYRHNAVTAKYAAILDCSNPDANAILRLLEPPLHDDWDAARAANGQRVVRALKDFVGRGLKAKIRTQIGEEVKMDSLRRLLPSTLGAAQGTGTAGLPVPGEGTGVESSSVQGKPADELAISNAKRRAVPVTVVRPAVNDGDRRTQKGRDRGGTGKRQGEGTGLPGTGSEGDGRARIHAGDIDMRSWTDPQTGELVVVVKATTPVAGDLTLAPLGTGGQVETGYELPIQDVLLETEAGLRPLGHNGNTIEGLNLDDGSLVARLRIRLDEPHRYRMGVM